MKKTHRLSLYLAALTFISGAVLFVMNTVTEPAIKEQQIKSRNEALKIVVSRAASFEAANEDESIFKALNKKGKQIGLIYNVKPKGYGGPIDMLVGIANQKITGVNIMNHTETPGLGAVATDIKVGFLKQFIGKSVSNKFIAKQDVASITGATITSQAVADGIKKAIAIYKVK